MSLSTTILGTAKSAAELKYGEDLLSGRQFTDEDYVTATMSLIPFEGAAAKVVALGTIKVGTVKQLLKLGDKGASVMSAAGYAAKVSNNTKVVGYYTTSTANSTILRDELKAAGIAPPPYPNDAHHIVPAGDTRESAQLAQRLLKSFGIEINSAANGVFLPPVPKRVKDGAGIYRRGIETCISCKLVQ
ncbi:AHH domain-containing protein [Ectobacillus panaciterrae]|uniref:AHH domain-containing protein n=1 Tax=Ectobacillus panaciterrae TaxID=363872 RepID=UPI0004052FFD|nr:AHH domain-containing protein [Ectobacillus panaciterrae]